MVSLKCKEILCLTYSGLLFISGILLITFSVILSYRVLYHFNFVPSDTIGPFIVIFILGFLHLFLTWLGIKGPTREHNFHIVLFMVFTLILLVCEFAVGIWSMILWDEISILTLELMRVSFKEMINFDKKEWSKLQSDLKCCGLYGVTDYSSKHNSTPFSCTNPELSNVTIQYIYEEGCQKPLVKYVKRILLDGALIGFISGIFQKKKMTEKIHMIMKKKMIWNQIHRLSRS
ncbi:uncharacterized protein LOC108908776 isoform X2 [Anoplophora glabripennis]|uniref:uncharacterized protein LOC108908776 isoform X2 n=1 Tax=Anoplophora glabripennis TaxID=217634 RepID=UPI00087475C1|nr:uncharacterized protein LOC108908776 isoform X2 [Anoplophora glabripennis]